MNNQELKIMKLEALVDDALEMLEVSEEEEISLAELYDAGIGFIIQEPVELTEEMEDLPYLRTVSREDSEFEKFSGFETHPITGEPIAVMDDSSSIDAYFTTQGENPVIFPEAVLADLNRSAGGWSDAQPDYPVTYYSNAEGKAQSRRFHSWVRWIERDTNADRLQRGWKEFWKQYFQSKNRYQKALVDLRKRAAMASPSMKKEFDHMQPDYTGFWMFPKQIGAVKALFEKYGIKGQQAK